MKALIVTSYFPPEIGAAATRISNLANGLQARGVQVDILSPLPNYPKGSIFSQYKGKFNVVEEIDSHLVFRYWIYATVSKNPIKRAFAMFSFALMIWCFSIRRRIVNQYDCIIVQSPPLLVSYSAMILFKKVLKKKVFLNVSDIWPLSAVELGVMRNNGLSYKYLSHCERFIYKEADAIMGQSEEIINHIRKIEPNKETFLYRNLQPVE